MKKLSTTYSILIILISGILFSFVPINNETTELENAIFKVINGFKEKNASQINELINKDFGLIIMYKRGVMNEYSKTNRINFTKPIPEYLPYFDFKIYKKISYETLPTFNCETGKWNKTGLFCNLNETDSLLSTTAINLVKYRNDNINENEINSFLELERKSRRIVLIDENEGELIFYLTLINNKWQLTILDRVSSDCSA